TQERIPAAGTCALARGAITTGLRAPGLGRVAPVNVPASAVGNLPELLDIDMDEIARRGWHAQEASIRDLFTSKYLLPLIALGLFFAIGNITANTLGQFNTYLYVNVAGSDVSTASTISLCSYA